MKKRKEIHSTTVAKTTPHTVVSNCNFHREGPAVPPGLVEACRALADAAKANAEAIKAIADHMAGPIDNSCMMKFEGPK